MAWRTASMGRAGTTEAIAAFHVGSHEQGIPEGLGRGFDGCFEQRTHVIIMEQCRIVTRCTFIN
jgi:hypothetical protein